MSIFVREIQTYFNFQENQLNCGKSCQKGVEILEQLIPIIDR